MQLVDIEPLMKNGWSLQQTGESNRLIRTMSLADIPIVDVEPVRHGYWISFLDGGYIMPEMYYKCSRCGRVECREEPYCHCGAKMHRQ